MLNSFIYNFVQFASSSLGKFASSSFGKIAPLLTWPLVAGFSDAFLSFLPKTNFSNPINGASKSNEARVANMIVITKWPKNKTN